MGIIARLRFFYSGKGDTILVEAREGARGSRWGFVDCQLTDSSGSRQRVHTFVQANVKDLEFICLTHPDWDHFRGMKELLEELYYERDSDRLRLGNFWDSGLDYSLAAAIADCLGLEGSGRRIIALSQYLSQFSLRDALQRQFMQRGTVGLVEFGDFYFASINPRANRVDRFNRQAFENELGVVIGDPKELTEESNALSVVLVMMHKWVPVNLVLGGDATSDVWEEALNTWERLAGALGRADKRFSFIKVSHHGAKTSLHLPLYRDYVVPDRTVAVFTVSPGDRNHPHPDVLAALRESCVRAYATMRRGEAAEIPGDLLLLGRPPEGAGYVGLCGRDVLVEIDEDGAVHVTPEDCSLY